MIKIAASDMDFNYHTNQSMYYRFSLDAAYEAWKSGFLRNFIADPYASSGDEQMEINMALLTEEEEAMLGKSPHELVLLLSEKQKQIDMATSSTESAKLEIEQLKAANFGTTK
ncbi:hypothetical protein LSH36_391g02065 [Paralvinella palmiformis]|uniref:Uncharacterized protein n=1 Tax=Paralvinella palmiformis TaxID=53620 RepID=A0AAD9JCW0_9ANNE|nr:hypothetical protein LSH36_391g02065 [Paralvinella palmiformis]